MKLIVGLGNPGRKYKKTRHNVGFEALDAAAKQLGIKFKKAKLVKGSVAEYGIANEKVIFLKPKTFMNLSGEAVQPLADYYNIELENILVIYDDLDLSPGALRLRQSGGHGGHNGIKSLISHLGSKEFKRIRIGVGRPPEGVSVTSHVLGTFAPDEKKEVENTINTAAKACETWTNSDFQQVMNEYNKKV
ncbi:aminoacyl-tRNA hydrolase [Salsuginibacillus kocurii]|uniref:aminoacyl-tRNA hydrolase n=1 Tax=Salsuginibacillus kocurii TaxID=427078 RepID=UPI00037C81EA|nr:aminoacyl-tRNA hydrolase [Salsuginibacillus kocurii]